MNDFQRLKEMGIPVFQVKKPELLPLSDAPQALDLPVECELLLVANSPFSHVDDLILFEKILAAIGLASEQALCVTPEAFIELRNHHLRWCWFMQCDPLSFASNAIIDGVKRLTSPLLSHLQQDPAAKQILWQQIKQQRS